MKKLTFLLLVITSFGCGNLFMASYGIKTGSILSDQEVKNSFKKNNIEDFGNYYLNDKLIVDLDRMVMNDSNTFIYTNYLVQPLQIIIFNNDSMVSQISNCNLGGFPNLNWDQYLTEFPIKHNNSEAYPKIGFRQYQSYLTSLDSKQNPIENKQYKMLVIYSDFMGRQSKRLIKKSKAYFKKHKELNSVEILFVNANNSSVENF